MGEKYYIKEDKGEDYYTKKNQGNFWVIYTFKTCSKGQDPSSLFHGYDKKFTVTPVPKVHNFLGNGKLLIKCEKNVTTFAGGL